MQFSPRCCCLCVGRTCLSLMHMPSCAASAFHQIGAVLISYNSGVRCVCCLCITTWAWLGVEATHRAVLSGATGGVISTMAVRWCELQVL